MKYFILSMLMVAVAVAQLEPDGSMSGPGDNGPDPSLTNEDFGPGDNSPDPSFALGDNGPDHPNALGDDGPDRPLDLSKEPGADVREANVSGANASETNDVMMSVIDMAKLKKFILETVAAKYASQPGIYIYALMVLLLLLLLCYDCKGLHD